MDTDTGSEPVKPKNYKRGAGQPHVLLAAKIGQKQGALKRLEAHYRTRRSLLLTEIADLKIEQETMLARRAANAHDKAVAS